MEKANKLNKKTIIIGSVIAVLLIGGIVIYRRRKKKKEAENKQSETPKEVEGTKSTTSETNKLKENVSEIKPTTKEAPKPIDEESVLNEVLKNTLGKGSLKNNNKGVKYVELVINDPNKKPYNWRFYGSKKFEVFDDKNVLAFSGAFANGGLSQQIKRDNYAFGTANLSGITLNDARLDGLANKMFTLKD